MLELKLKKQCLEFINISFQTETKLLNLEHPPFFWITSLNINIKLTSPLYFNYKRPVIKQYLFVGTVSSLQNIVVWGHWLWCCIGFYYIVRCKVLLCTSPCIVSLNDGVNINALAALSLLPRMSDKWKPFIRGRVQFPQFFCLTLCLFAVVTQSRRGAEKLSSFCMGAR